MKTTNHTASLASLAVLALALVAGCPNYKQDPTAGFRAMPESGFAPLHVQFYDVSQGNTEDIYSWTWDFNDGSYTHERNPQHVFSSAGVYRVRLAVGTRHGTDSYTSKITVLAPNPPLAAFSVSPGVTYIGEAVQFRDDSAPGTRGVDTWLWEFGDGQTSTEQHPAHAYNRIGGFDVTLTVSGPAGESTLTRANLVEVLPKRPPRAAFTFDTVPGAPLTLSFTDTSRSGSDELAQWLWDFGDGQTSAEQNSAHTWAEPGTYAVSLTVRSGHGTDSLEQLITLPVDGPEKGLDISSRLW